MNYRRSIKLSIALFLCASIFLAAAKDETELPPAPRVSIDLTLKGEDGKPLEGFDVTGYYLGAGASEPHKSVTDKDGKATLDGRTWLRAAASAKRDGWYWSEKDVGGPKTQESDAPVTRYDAELTLRKIKNPIPLFAKYVEFTLLDEGKSIGYDLALGDYIHPRGKGEVSDLILTYRTVRKEGPLDYEFRIELKFSNPDDGIVSFKTDEQSFFKAPFYKAPEKGYKNKWVYTRSATPEGGYNTNARADRCFSLRLRTKRDENGKIVKANYAKIYRDFPKFVYYFNPKVNDRNLEFDIEKNLAKKRVTKP